MKNVLIITYYWPPMGGGGVQRWLKTSKYLKNNSDWNPIIFTVKDAETSIHDNSLEKEVKDLTVLRSSIWEPFKLYKLLTGRRNEAINPGFLKTSNKKSFLDNFSMWIRSNFFIPDAKSFWITTAFKQLQKIFKKYKIDIIVSTGPPHTTHLIAMKVKKKYKIPWLADFRDPWTNIDFYQKLKLSLIADKIHRYYELNVLKNADIVTTVSESWAEDFYKIYNREIIVINNGFDPEDFEKKSSKVLDNKFSITHAGSMNGDRNHDIFWATLKAICDSHLDFREKLEVKLIGPIDFSVRESISKYNLNKNVTFIDELPHDKVINHLISSQLLYLPLNNSSNISGIIPGKTYEYIAAKRPIICIGDTNGDTAKILTQTNSGYIFSLLDSNSLEEKLLYFYSMFKNNDLKVFSKNISIYSRKKLSTKFVDIFNKMNS
tara:strand:- start:1469 stop:2767 length:1299 start_codon:yes stop_codon:yes gene_type:complete